MTSAAGCLLTAALLFNMQPGPAGHHHGRDRCEKHCQKSGDGDRTGNRYCFMPCDFVIVIPPGQGPPPEESAALFPPNPAKLVEVIQAGAAAIGRAAGDLAGAAAALPIGILL